MVTVCGEVTLKKNSLWSTSLANVPVNELPGAAATTRPTGTNAAAHSTHAASLPIRYLPIFSLSQYLANAA
jgi:hypothetical protein